MNVASSSNNATSRPSARMQPYVPTSVPTSFDIERGENPTNNRLAAVNTNTSLRSKLISRISLDNNNMESGACGACTVLAIGTLASIGTGVSTYYSNADFNGETEGLADRKADAEHKAFVNGASVFGGTLVLTLLAGGVVGAAHGCYEGTEIAHQHSNEINAGIAPRVGNYMQGAAEGAVRGLLQGLKGSCIAYALCCMTCGGGR